MYAVQDMADLAGFQDLPQPGLRLIITPSNYKNIVRGEYYRCWQVSFDQRIGPCAHSLQKCERLISCPDN